MLLIAIALAALTADPASMPRLAGVEQERAPALDGREPKWFGGSFEEALEAVKGSGRLVLVYFWPDRAGWCKKLEKESFSKPSVAAAMERMLCVRIDTQTEAGAKLARTWAAERQPTLLFLDSDARAHDVIVGYLGPAFFEAELARIASGERTIPALRARVDEGTADLDLRYELAKKLAQVGDGEASRALIDTIRELDPEGRSRASRRLALDAATRDVQLMPTPADEPIRALLAEETDPGILYSGWSWIYRVQGFLATRPGAEAESAKHATLAREAARRAWPHCPAVERSLFGNEIAWSFYEQRDALAPDEKAFALEVAQQVARLAPEDPNVLDTWACCLFMNGRADEALALVERCIQLEPENAAWKDRLAELRAGPGG